MVQVAAILSSEECSSQWITLAASKGNQLLGPNVMLGSFANLRGRKEGKLLIICHPRVSHDAFKAHSGHRILVKETGQEMLQ